MSTFLLNIEILKSFGIEFLEYTLITTLIFLFFVVANKIVTRAKKLKEAHKAILIKNLYS